MSARVHYQEKPDDEVLCQSVPKVIAVRTADKEKVTCKRCQALLKATNIDYASIELRTMVAQFEKNAGADIYAEFDTEFPECLCVVVLDDVGPEKMHTAVQEALKLGVPRICANVVEKKLAGRVRDAFESGGFKTAWAESWMVNVATVRT
jgi:hypothetical protein